MSALVVVGHGSHLNPDSAEPIFAHADRIRACRAFDEVREAFWKEEPSLREVLRTLRAETVYVVPLFMSEGYFTEEVIPRELRITGEEPLDVDKTVHYTSPVGTHDAMTDVIVQRAASVTDRAELGNVTLVIVGHGTERNEQSAASTRYHADRVRNRDRFSAVTAMFMDESPKVDNLTEYVDTEDVVLVPLFVADGYHTTEDIPEDVGLTEDYRDGWDVPASVDGHRVWYAGAVGTEPLLARVIAERAAEAGAVIDPDIVQPDSAESTTQQRDLEAAVSDPVDILLKHGGALDGLRVEERSTGYSFETPTDRHDELDETEVRALATDHAEYVSNWHFFENQLTVSDAGWVFLRMLEDASERAVSSRYETLESGVTSQWGQLAITVSLPNAKSGTIDGIRRYDLRNRSDQEANLADLEIQTNPLEAREIAKYDDEGRYRPLKTAPTLASGWAFSDLCGSELLQAVDFVYPATVTNWYMEQRGELDVTHWRETAERQTGIYEVVDELPRDALEWAIEACCTDTACVKRREWEANKNNKIDAPGGKGEFPCREPCSLFVAAAREFALSEQETDLSAVDELSQIEAIGDAVADDEVAKVRPGDVKNPTNQYRIRYLRSKLFDGYRPTE